MFLLLSPTWTVVHGYMCVEVSMTVPSSVETWKELYPISSQSLLCKMGMTERSKENEP